MIADDRKARTALRLHVALDIGLMGTESFIEWMATSFGIKSAETAWQAIEVATGYAAPVSEGEDPVYIRKPG